MRDLRRRLWLDFNALFDLVSWRSCLVCDGRLRRAAGAVCRPCARALLRQRLVAPIAPAAFEGETERLAGVWAAATYRGAIRECILRYKFRAALAVEPVLTSLFVQRFRSLEREFRPDLIVPVPASPVRFLVRGTNLPQALARTLSDRTGLPWSRRLRRAPLGRRQALKSKAERLTLSPSVFRVWRPRALVGRAVLLVDDVLTTGGTARACTQALVARGVHAVGILALAHG
jgi:ComF family protein